MDSSAVAVKGLETGQILHCSWGYSMILNSFYKVLKGAQVGKMAVIQEIGKTTVTHDGYGQAGKQVANEAELGKVTTHKVKAGYQGEVGVKAYHGWAHAWDGQAKSFDTYD